MQLRGHGDAEVIKRLKHATHDPLELGLRVVKSLWEGKTAPPACLERLGLADARSFKDMFGRKLFAGNLQRSGVC